ncbi:kinase-like domain-containing protein, partial [Rhizophagus irregularis DAOM 181602=DAOM 197198]
IAPEILRGQSYTKAADIYSFGIIMYEVISGLPPYHEVNHEKPLALSICQGLRPIFKIKVPKLILHLIKRCLDASPSNRPTINEIKITFEQWWFVEYNSYRKDPDNPNYETELIKQIKDAEKINNNLTTDNITSTNLALSYETHPEAIYTSRLLDFNNLPEPKNSDGYYEQYDNISSMKYPVYLRTSQSLQILDITKLKMIS